MGGIANVLTRGKSEELGFAVVGPRSPVKLPQPMKPATLPGVDGEDLVPYLYYLRESNRERFDVIVDSLRAAFADLEELSFPPVAAGVLAMTWKDKNFKKPIYMNELSEGTLRFIWLVSLLLSPNLSTVTMIDEPEVSLHPELLGMLPDIMREASRRTQFKGYVAKLLAGSNAADHVIALTDVYTGSTPPEFRDAADAKAQMRRWVGNEPRFYPHAAKFDFEAWLLPYWGTIQRLAGHNMRVAAGNPETVNHNNPPAHRIKSIFEAALQGQLCQTARCRSHFEGE